MIKPILRRVISAVLALIIVCTPVIASAQLHAKPRCSPGVQQLLDKANDRGRPIEERRNSARNAMLMATKLHDQTGVGRSLLAQCDTQIYSGQNQAAVITANQALAVAKKIRDPWLEADAELFVAGAHGSLGEFNALRLHHARCLAIAKKIGYLEVEGRVLRDIGLVEQFSGRPARGVKPLLRAIDIFRALGQRGREASVRGMLAVTYEYLGEHEQGLGQLEALVPVYHSLGARHDEAFALFNMSQTLALLGQRARAIDACDRAIGLYQELGLKTSEAAGKAQLGEILMDFGNLDAAQKLFEEALPLLRTDSTFDLGGALNGLAFIHAKKGDYERAIALLKESLAHTQRVSDRENESGALRIWAGIDLDRDRFDDALLRIRPAIGIYHERGDPEGEAALLVMAAHAARGLQRNTLAVAQLKQAINLYQQIRTNIKGMSAEHRATYLSLHTPTYRELADLLCDQGRLAEAQQVMDFLKDDEYFQFLRRRAGKPSDTVDLTKFELNWLKQYNALGDDLAKFARERDELLKIAPDYRTPQQRDRLKVLRERADAAGAAFHTFLKEAEKAFNSAGVESARLDDLKGTAALQAALAELPSHPAALYTLVTSDGVRIIVSIPGLNAARQAKTLLPASELNKKIIAFRQALSDPRLDPRPLAAELYDVLVRPVEKDLQDAGTQSLMWSLDGALRMIPLWALYDRVTGQYLIEKYPSSLFTPRTVDRLVVQAHPWTGAGFGVSAGGKVGNTTFTPLPGVAKELAAAHAALGGQSPLLDQNFTFNAFRDALETGVRVIHVATHFRFKPGDDAGTYLLLGKGETLSVEQLKDMADGSLASVDLLVLSACETAMGGDGSEFEGFSLLAQLKGAGAVLATLWPVADDSTALLMGEFYRLRMAHPEWTKLGALREAQLEMMRGTLDGTGPADPRSENVSVKTTSAAPSWPRNLPRYSHPYYWAPFVLSGNWK